MAADSLARSTLTPVAIALVIALDMGGFDIPEDVPGVDDGVAGAVIPG